MAEVTHQASLAQLAASLAQLLLKFAVGLNGVTQSLIYLFSSTQHC